MSELAVSNKSFDLSPQTFEQALTFSNYLAESDMVPKDFKGKPGNCLIAMQWGSELGLKPLQAIQNLAIINGRPSLWGDAVIALARGSVLCEFVIETDDGTTATCKVKRRGEPEQARTFSIEDAKAAGLHGKAGPWTQYPKRMRQLRARAFALRDVFPDVLRGLPVAEELLDTPTEKFMGAADVVKPAELTEWPADLFAERLPEWHKAMQEKRKGVNADSIIAKAKTKYPLSELQEAAIRTVPASVVTDVDGVIFMTYAQVADKLNKADNVDKLDEAASLIGTVADEVQRHELTVSYENRKEQLLNK